MASAAVQVFFPPELASQMELEALSGGGIEGKTGRLEKLYFQALRSPGHDEALDRAIVSLVLDHARSVIAHPSKPVHWKIDTFLNHPFAELDIEASLEETAFFHEPEDFRVTYQEEKPFSLVAMLDTSSSMSGEKHLLASVAVAVLLLEVGPRAASVITFHSQANTIKKLGLEEAPEATVLRFLRHKPRGFTNIAVGLEQGLKQLKGRTDSRRRVGLIATDGRTTEGGDPLEVARDFDFLVVLHLHGPGSHLDASKAIAQKGNGACLEVERFEDLPRRLYDAIRLLARS